jgi:hypothetical protein
MQFVRENVVRRVRPRRRTWEPPAVPALVSPALLGTPLLSAGGHWSFRRAARLREAAKPHVRSMER